MRQTRQGSLIEAGANMLLGLAINTVLNLAVFPHFGWTVSAAQSIQLALLFTFISFARTYLLRRAFNAIRPTFTVTLHEPEDAA